ncbi:MAG: glycosyltransferase family 4 protein [Rickettsiales bacterium]|nr:glycosyltransferase family 4 protein [Rickettsiales bacterium]
MKIVNIILTSQNGGAEQAFLDYSSALKNLGHEVVAILKADAPYAAEVEKLGITVKKIENKFGYYDFFAVQNIKKILQETAADLVVSHISRATVLTRKAVKKIKNKKVFQIAVNHSGNVKRSIGADIVLSVNQRIFFDTVEKGQNAERSFVIPNAIDLSDVLEASPQASLQTKEKITIGTIGRLDRSKGFDYAIKSLKNLEKISDKNFVLKIAGDGYYEPVLRNLVKELGLEEKVEFLGWIKNKKEFFNSIDIFCLPSKNEPFGIVILEAMKFAKPIISTDADGPREILTHEKDALMVALEPQTNTEERIASAVVRMVNEPELMNELVKNAALKLRERYSYKALEKRLGEIVGKVG